MCTSQCSRLFKKYMKKTLFDFILEYRIERSLADLLDPGCSMAEAAAGAGLMTPIIIQRYLCGSRDVRHRCIGRRCGEDRA